MELLRSVTKALRLAGYRCTVEGDMLGALGGNTARGVRLTALDDQSVGVAWAGPASPLRRAEEECRLREVLRIFGYALAVSGAPGIAFTVRAPAAAAVPPTRCAG